MPQWRIAIWNAPTMTLTVNIKLNNQDTPPSFALADNARHFTGIAHSGKPFTQYGTRYIVDLAGIQYRAETGVLLEHDANRKAGVGRLSVSGAGLAIDGKLLSTEYGEHIAQTADEGFPWELSAYIQSGAQDQLSQGEAVVNGQTVSAPIVILRDCAVREVSFVAVGADAHTAAVVLSDGTAFEPQFSLSQPLSQENSMTQEEQAEFDALKQKVADLEAQNEQLQKDKTAAEKKAKVDKKLSAAGFTAAEQGFNGVAPETYAVLLSLDDVAADAVIGNLKLSGQPEKPALPAQLTGDTPPAAGEVKLSGLLADAQRRREQQQHTI